MLLQGRSVHDIGGSGHLYQVPECAYFVMGCVVFVERDRWNWGCRFSIRDKTSPLESELPYFGYSATMTDRVLP